MKTIKVPNECFMCPFIEHENHDDDVTWSYYCGATDHLPDCHKEEYLTVTKDDMGDENIAKPNWCPLPVTVEVEE